MFFYLVGIVLLLDAIWLWIMKPFYDRAVRAVQKQPITVAVLPAIASYICVISSLWFFAIPLISGNNMNKKNKMSLIWRCLLYGGGLGLVTYGIFNFTNMAIFKNYPLWVAAMDTTWGVILYTLTTYTYMTLT